MLQIWGLVVSLIAGLGYVRLCIPTHDGMYARKSFSVSEKKKERTIFSLLHFLFPSIDSPSSPVVSLEGF